jgi:hypothetical protein
MSQNEAPLMKSGHLLGNGQIRLRVDQTLDTVKVVICVTRAPSKWRFRRIPIRTRDLIFDWAARELETDLVTTLNAQLETLHRGIGEYLWQDRETGDCHSSFDHDALLTLLEQADQTRYGELMRVSDVQYGIARIKEVGDQGEQRRLQQILRKHHVRIRPGRRREQRDDRADVNISRHVDEIAGRLNNFFGPMRRRNTPGAQEAYDAVAAELKRRNLSPVWLPYILEAKTAKSAATRLIAAGERPWTRREWKSREFRRAEARVRVAAARGRKYLESQ